MYENVKSDLGFSSKSRHRDVRLLPPSKALLTNYYYQKLVSPSPFLGTVYRKREQRYISIDTVKKISSRSVRRKPEGERAAKCLSMPAMNSSPLRVRASRILLRVRLETKIGSDTKNSCINEIERGLGWGSMSIIANNQTIQHQILFRRSNNIAKQ